MEKLLSDPLWWCLWIVNDTENGAVIDFMRCTSRIHVGGGVRRRGGRMESWTKRSSIRKSGWRRRRERRRGTAKDLGRRDVGREKWMRGEGGRVAGRSLFFSFFCFDRVSYYQIKVFSSTTEDRKTRSIFPNFFFTLEHKVGGEGRKKMCCRIVETRGSWRKRLDVSSLLGKTLLLRWRCSQGPARSHPS